MGKKIGTLPAPPELAFRRRIRVRKEDSAFVYCILESHEGIVSYSTLEHRPGDPHRDLELQIPAGLAFEVDEVLKELGDLIYELEPRQQPASPDQPQ